MNKKVLYLNKDDCILEISFKIMNDIKEVVFENQLIRFLHYEGNYYYIFGSHNKDIHDIDNQVLKINFHKCIVSQNVLEDKYEIYKQIYSFEINEGEKLVSKLNTYHYTENKFNILFSVSGNIFKVEVFGERNTVEKLQIQKVLFIYLFLLTSYFFKPIGKKISYKENDDVIYEYYSPTFSDLEKQKFTIFKIVLTPIVFQNTFNNFLSLYSNSKYPLEVFIYTQTLIPYNIQQRVSLVLNSLEGVLKTNIDSGLLRLPIGSDRKKRIMTSVKNNTENFIDSKSFKSDFAGLKSSEKDTILEKVNNAVSRIDELTFDETLELSKIFNPSGFEMVKKISPMPLKFWYRCKQHRNFHAHLTDKKHPGFDGSQSLFAMFILSSYYRYLILEFCEIDSEILQPGIQSETTTINSWIKDNRLSDNIISIK